MCLLVFLNSLCLWGHCRVHYHCSLNFLCLSCFLLMPLFGNFSHATWSLWYFPLGKRSSSSKTYLWSSPYICHIYLQWFVVTYFCLFLPSGATFLVWFGPTVRLTVSDPDLIREIFTSKSEFYEKNEAHPLIKQLEGDGLLSLKGEKWAHHRKIITPTFHMENLKVSPMKINK